MGVEISLRDGLRKIYQDGGVLKSDKLGENEYIKYSSIYGICYEDNCTISRSPQRAYEILVELEWSFGAKFYWERL